MRKKLVVAAVFFLLFSTQLPTFVWASKRSSETMSQPVKISDTLPFVNGMAKTKKVLFPNGDLYWIKQFEFSSDKDEPFTVSIPLEGKTGTFRFVDRQASGNSWVTAPLLAELPQPSGFLQTDQISMLINVSNLYTRDSYGTIEEQSNPFPVSVKHTADGYLIQVQFPQKKEYIAEIWGLESKQPLVDWSSNPNLDSKWLTVDLQVHSKWSWDGYYVRVPQTYTPYSPIMFWRLPTNYAAYFFLVDGGSRAAEDLGWVMLDTILPNQNTDGYWETMPRSEWLWIDYEIGAGFFDTRFNTDMATLLLKGYQTYDTQNFFQAAQRYSNYLMKHMEHNHFTNYGISEGWLVSDYAWNQPHQQTHVSLNHQLQEMNFLYHMYLETNQDYYKEFADRLLYGVKNIKSKWIKPNLDLHYAYLNNGSMGLQDYPFLTYNDLLESQSVLLQIYGMSDPDLEELLASKKQWMDQTGVKGYRYTPFMEFAM